MSSSRRWDPKSTDEVWDPRVDRLLSQLTDMQRQNEECRRREETLAARVSSLTLEIFGKDNELQQLRSDTNVLDDQRIAAQSQCNEWRCRALDLEDKLRELCDLYGLRSSKFDVDSNGGSSQSNGGSPGGSKFDAYSNGGSPGGSPTTLPDRERNEDSNEDDRFESPRSDNNAADEVLPPFAETRAASAPSILRRPSDMPRAAVEISESPVISSKSPNDSEDEPHLVHWPFISLAFDKQSRFIPRYWWFRT